MFVGFLFVFVVFCTTVFYRVFKSTHFLKNSRIGYFLCVNKCNQLSYSFVSTLSEKYCVCEIPCFSKRRLLAHLITMRNKETSNWAQIPKESKKNNQRF